MEPTITINWRAGDHSHAIQKRQLGRINVGFYCEGCGEFIAFSVVPPHREDKVAHVQYACDGPISFACPFCILAQDRLVSQLETVRLTEGNKRRPPSPGAVR